MKLTFILLFGTLLFVLLHEIAPSIFTGVTGKSSAPFFSKGMSITRLERRAEKVNGMEGEAITEEYLASGLEPGTKYMFSGTLRVFAGKDYWLCESDAYYVFTATASTHRFSVSYELPELNVPLRKCTFRTARTPLAFGQEKSRGIAENGSLVLYSEKAITDSQADFITSSEHSE